MNRRLRRFLTKFHGLAADATDAVAVALAATLTGRDKQVADALAQTKDSEDSLSAAVTATLVALNVRAEDYTPQPPEDGNADDATPPANAALSTPPAPGNNPASTPDNTPPADQGDTPAPGNAAPGNTALTAADVDDRVTAALDARARRQRQITTLCRQLGLGDDLARRHLERGTDFATFQALAGELAQANTPITGLGVRVGDDGRASVLAGITDAIALRCGVELYEEAPGQRSPHQPVALRRGDDGRPVAREPHGRTDEFAALSLVEIGRRFLAHLGVAGAMSMDPWQVARLATDRMQLAGHIGGVALSHSTSDFSGIFANVLNKKLLPGYEQTPSTHREFTAERQVKDFKQVTFNQLGHTSRLRQVLEGGEYTYGTLSEKTATAQVYKFGLLIALTWEMMVNDDLDAFSQRALGFAETAQLLEDDEVYGHLLGNPTLEEDTKALFHVDHNNLSVGGAAALSKDSLKAMRKAMATQKGIAPSANETGRTLNLRPNLLLVPWELEADAAQLVASRVEIGASNGTPNFKFINQLRVVSEARLDDDSTTAFYLVAGNRASAPAAHVLRLRGYATPTIEQIHTGSSVDGMTYKCRHVFGKKITDFRPWQKNAGA